MQNSQKNILISGFIIIVIILVGFLGFKYKKNNNPTVPPVNTTVSTSTNPAETTTPTTPVVPTTKITPPVTKKPAAFVVSPIIFHASTTYSKNPLITWETSKPTQTKIFYDTKEPFTILIKTASSTFQSTSHGFSLTDTTLATEHSFEFPNLSLGSQYYYAIESLDGSNNSIVVTGSFLTPATR